MGKPLRKLCLNLALTGLVASFVITNTGPAYTAGPGGPRTMSPVAKEVETDKSTMEVPTTISGTIKEIKVKEGEIVPVGSILAVVE